MAGLLNTKTKALDDRIDDCVDKPTSATTGNLAKFDANDDIEDAGVATETTMTSGDTKVPTTGAVKKVTDPLVTWVQNHVVYGVIGADGSAGQTHADGGAYDFNADYTAGEIMVNNVWSGAVGAGTNFDLGNGGASPLDATNDTQIIAVYAAEAAGSVSIGKLAGSAAPAASATAPTDGDIDTAVGHSNWIRLFNFTVTRTGAAAATGAVDNTVRPVL